MAIIAKCANHIQFQLQLSFQFQRAVYVAFCHIVKYATNNKNNNNNNSYNSNNNKQQQAPSNCQNARHRDKIQSVAERRQSDREGGREREKEVEPTATGRGYSQGCLTRTVCKTISGQLRRESEKQGQEREQE